MTTILLIVVAENLSVAYRKNHPKNDFSYYVRLAQNICRRRFNRTQGNYNTDGIIAIYSFSGVSYGMVELIRRVIPRDIVGGNVQKLRRMVARPHFLRSLRYFRGFLHCTSSNPSFWK